MDPKASPDAPERTPLEERLVSLIRANGPITIADYMADALGHPHEGYYMANAPIGAAGDFTTAPEISQIFGELVGMWLVQCWLEMGEPRPFSLVELGPGRGVLMADILRAAAKVRPGFFKGADIWLVETSGRLRHEQQQRLKAIGAKPLWADEFGDLPEGPMLIVANELFDCLPIRQFERLSTGWRERLVGVDAAGALEFVHARTPPPPDIVLPYAEETPEGAIAEVSAPREALAVEIAKAVIEHGGRALIFDYGHLASGLGDTLQAVRRHQYWPVLAAPGKADITAHVDFEAIARAAMTAGAAVWGPLPQGRFLQGLGLKERLEALVAGKDATEAQKARSSAHRISAPEEMGEVFKAMCISSPALPPPAGFEGL